ncbi:response regulator transcription factor [Paenibacillus motobuensis]|uniref:response regulator transcription factor n=1 Tax=Paenibacillus TaxID=44249 RepID=UPI0020418805|nr:MULTISPECIES: response regulator transcription factor [Paenibacillus]MCM3041483.1 response regulator transcription factor [Paenibacillus lutimineralis]MCM3648587.1 response regulator transcription factor [Paenibacillus motobuensis]
MREKILIADDEREIVEFMRDALEDEGYDVRIAYDGGQVLDRLEDHEQLDLIILDIMMPHLDGLEVCQVIRDRVSCPILFLSARSAEADRIRGLAVGGDDYIVKPFSMQELKARIKAHLRREQRVHLGRQPKLLHHGYLTIDLDSLQLFYKNIPIPLTSREFELFQLLFMHPNQVFSREQMYEKIWGYDAEGDSATVTEHIKNIRAKLAVAAPEQTFVTTVWGVGYKFNRQ